ncbi:MAG: enoyl-CoA hydratase/isomerase family protein [Candidatus Thermoplasmatota archaeon]|jgi:enoyl-CoA hydratase/carnithine racemase|nr:enoyl-CoA hydratase/isomerase family protein [Candidatus Thermoplasmatota archaeon]MCL5929668.1 enoyl-CoA hydratase/isomerase family protein [Candidatus Thermoplasmatota archaeon]
MPEPSNLRDNNYYPFSHVTCVNYEEIVVKEGEISEVILNRPKKFNALNKSLKSELVEVLENLNQNDSIKAIILSGMGGNFSTGQDINDIVSFSGKDVSGWMEELKRMFDAVRNVDKPTIASIEGYATGAGFQLSLLCDIRVSSPTAKLGLPEINIGIPSITGSKFLRMLGVPIPKIAELVMTGNLISGAEGKEIGIINYVAMEGRSHSVSLDIAKQLISKPRMAQRVHKRLLRTMTEDLYNESFRFAVEADAEVFNTGEPSKIMRSFLKR